MATAQPKSTQTLPLTVLKYWVLLDRLGETVIRYSSCEALRRMRLKPYKERHPMGTSSGMSSGPDMISTGTFSSASSTLEME